MTKIIRFFFDDDKHRLSAQTIRKQVFVDEQNVPPSIESDENDEHCHHYLALINGQPAGTARWRTTVEGIKMERFAVLPEYRDKGVGTALVERMILDVKDEGLPIFLNAQDSAIEFYKQRGFVGDGDPFIVAEIVHQKMIWQETEKDPS